MIDTGIYLKIYNNLEEILILITLNFPQYVMAILTINLFIYIYLLNNIL